MTCNHADRPPGRRPPLPLLLAFALLLASVPAAQADEKTAVTVTVEDAVTSPGRPVRLEARVVRTGLLEIGVGGERVEFLINGKPIGTAMTGGDGRAYLEYTPRMRGNQKLTARVLPSKRVLGDEATGTVGSWEKRRPILLVERAALLEEERAPSPLGLGGLEHRQPEPAAGAVEELKRLSEFYFNLVYVDATGRGGSRREFQGWLTDHGFPFGLRVGVEDGEERLVEQIDELRAQGWDNIKAGVARSPSFARALVRQRLRTVWLAGEGVEADVPRRARTARDWREVRKLLQS